MKLDQKINLPNFLIFLVFLIFLTTKIKAEIYPPHKDASLAFVKQGSVVYDMREEKTWVLDKRKLFFVRVDSDSSPFFAYIYNQKGEVAYKTSVENIVYEDRSLELSPDKNLKIKSPPPKRFQVTDKEFNFTLRPSLAFETTNARELSDIYTSDLSSAIGNRFEIKLLYPTGFDLFVGLATNYQILNWGNVDNKEEVRLTSLNVGPYLEYNFSRFSNITFLENSRFNLGVELSAIFKAISNSDKENFSKTLLHLGYVKKFNSFLGPLTAEIYFRNQWILLKDTTRSNIDLSKEYQLQSLGLALGREWDF
jgi:hypothetical protein